MTQTLTVPNDQQAPVAHRCDDERLVTLARPLLGFPASRRFALHGLGEQLAPFLGLRSLDQPGLQFVVVAPGAFFSDYVLEIDDAEVELLDLRGCEDVEVLVLVTATPGTTPTVNLMGPLVLNRRTALATQVVLQDGIHAVAVPLDAPSARRPA
jgi:flagellar assembly factor FliW